VNEFCISIYSVRTDEPRNYSYFSAFLCSWFINMVLLFREKLQVDVTKETPRSMSQFRRIFNCCKTPGETMDTLNHYFKTGGCFSIDS